MIYNILNSYIYIDLFKEKKTTVYKWDKTGPFFSRNLLRKRVIFNRNIKGLKENIQLTKLFYSL